MMETSNAQRPTSNAQFRQPAVPERSHHACAIGRWTLGGGRWTLLPLFCILVACEKTPPSPPPKPLNKMFELPAFTLIERSGQPFDSNSMRGKVWVANFFFTDCRGICPLLNQQVAKVQQALKDQPSVRFLSISTDEKDTPAILRAYVDENKFTAADRWFFVTGPKSEVFELSAKGFKLALADATAVDAKEKFIHSTKLVLVDKQGWIRSYYDGIGENVENESARLRADIQRLLAEP
jgi:cytochrome oxidase Cu insertion factor (SCO1/SenC/PrrC family)